MKYGLLDDQLELIEKALKSHPEIETAVLFGSRAMDTFQPASDIDIALKGKKVNSKLAIRLISYFEEETNLPYFFDIISYPDLDNKNLKEEIDKQGIPIYRKGWQKAKLGKVTNIIGGFAFKSKHFSNSGDSYVVKIKNIKPPYIDIQDAVKVEMSFYKEQDLNKFKIQKGDFVIAMTGATIGKIGKMIEKQATYINQRVAKFEPKNNINKNFIYYILRQKNFQSFIQNNIDSNSAQENISAKSIGNFPILLPLFPHEQKAIAETLSSLDDKIELLHKQNKTLEDTAQTLFHKWFIEDAKDDWEEKSLSDIINFNPEYSLSKGTNAPYLEMKNVSPIHFNPNKWYFRNFTSGMKFKNGDTLLARITPCLENGKTCYVSFLNENEIGWGSTEFIVMRMKSPYHKFISYLLAKDHYFRDFATKNMTGTSGRQRVQATILKNFFIKIPRKEKIQELNLKLDAIQNKLFYNSKQITTLNKLLNTLLPKLMTGKVRLKCLH